MQKNVYKCKLYHKKKNIINTLRDIELSPSNSDLDLRLFFALVVALTLRGLMSNNYYLINLDSEKPLEMR